MPVSTLNLIREQARQQLTDDSDFLKRFLCFFEMRVPAYASTSKGLFSYLFPIILPPSSISVSEPFTVEATPSMGGGLYVEENGIVQRRISLRGTTGFRPRRLPVRAGFAFPAVLDSDQKSFSRELPQLVPDKISGQRHIQYLQDAVFRTYADLKQDPITSADTVLIFHNPRERESWLVVPQEFSIDQDSSSPVTYRYSIDLLAVDRADRVKADFSEDKGLLESLKDTLHTIQKAIDLATGAIQDLTAIAADIKSVVNSIDDILDSAVAVVDAATDFVNGVTELIETPFTFVESTVDMIETGVAHAHAWIEQGAAVLETTVLFPEHVRQKFQTLQDSMEIFGSVPEAYERSVDTVMRLLREKQESRRSLSVDRKASAINRGSPGAMAAYENLGTQLTAGDALSSSGQVTAGSLIRKYRSAREITVSQGDTLASLAAQHMGDARLWQYIAVLNGLKPPFVDHQANRPLTGGTGAGSVVTGRASGADRLPFPQAVGVGSKLMIPTNQRTTLDMPLTPVLGVSRTADPEDRYLGTDYQLEAVGGNYGYSRELYDIPIDTEGGGVDLSRISGVNNLSQAVIVRLLTERGHDPLYTNLGIQRIVSLNHTPTDIEIARFRVIDALAADARVSRVKTVRFEQGSPDNGRSYDSLIVDLQLGIRGFAESRTVQARL